MRVRVRSPAFFPAWLSHGPCSANLLAQQMLLSTGPARDRPNVRKAHARLVCLISLGCMAPAISIKTDLYNCRWFCSVTIQSTTRGNGRNSSKVIEFLLLSLSHPSANLALYLSKEIAEHIKPASSVLIWADNWGPSDKPSNDQAVWGTPPLYYLDAEFILRNHGGNLASHCRCPTHFRSNSCFSF